MSAKSKKKITAFPVSLHDGFPSQPGMTLRDYFAAKIAAGDAAAGDGWSDEHAQSGPSVRARLYYKIADAMMEARNQ